MEKTGKSPAECVFIDNSVKNLEVANDLGVRTILYNRDQEEYDGSIVNSFEELAKMLES